MVQTQPVTVEQLHVTMDTEHDTLDAALHAQNQAESRKEHQKAVVKTCRSIVQDAQTALDLALHSLADAKDQLKALDFTANAVGDNIWGPHNTFEEACAVYTTADGYLRFLEASLMSEMRHFRDLDLA